MVHHKGVQDSLKFEVVDHVVPPDATHCLRCGYKNFFGYSQETIRSKAKATLVPVVNGFVAPLGWQYIDVGIFGDYLEIYYKEASPAVAITTGLVITILVTVSVIWIGFVFLWVKWVELETQKMYAEAKQDKKELLDEGKITNEQYTELVIEQKPEEDMMKGIFPLLILLIIIIAMAGIAGKSRD